MDRDLDNTERRMRPVDPKAAEDRATRKAWNYGTPLRSAYSGILGDSPDCDPGDRTKAKEFLQRIEIAIETGGWTSGERTRLYRLRDKWKARAEGKDARFEVAGTRAGRLVKSVESAVDGVAKLQRKEKQDTAKLRDRRRKQHDWSAYEDLDAPFGSARGGLDLEDLEGDLGDDETGEAQTGRRALTDRDFVVPGQDSKGHSHRVQCRVMPAHYRALSMIYTSKKFPFRTMGDVVRWCIDKGIRELGTIVKTEKIESVISQADTIKDILAEEAYQHEFMATFDSLAKTVSLHTASQAVGEARRVVAIIRQRIEKMPEGYWRTRHLDEMKRQFGHLLDSGSVDGVSLIGGD